MLRGGFVELGMRLFVYRAFSSEHRRALEIERDRGESVREDAGQGGTQGREETQGRGETRGGRGSPGQGSAGRRTIFLAIYSGREIKGGCDHSAATPRSGAGSKSGQGRARTADTGLFRAVLYQLSYLTITFARCKSYPNPGLVTSYTR